MKKNTLIAVVLLGFVWQGWGQDEQAKQEMKQTLKKLEVTFEKYKKLYDEENKKLEELKSKVGMNSDQTFMTELSNQIEKTKKYNDSLADQLELFSNYKAVYMHKGFTAEEIDSLFEYIKEKFTKIPQENTETKVFTYFREDRVINRDILENKTGIEAEILKDVLKNTGEESYLGDITIPKENQEFYFYKYHDGEMSDVKFKFKKLDIEIRDGYFFDIRAFIETDDGNLHVFTNQVGISLLFYSQFGNTKKLLTYKYSQRNNTPLNAEHKYSDKRMTNLYIKVTDIMSYSYSAGNCFIPHDLTIKLPNKETDNKFNGAKYEIKQETHLEKILELRTYTDFLALFGDSNNGLVQVEGKAKFYLFPYPFRFLGSKQTLGQIEYLPALFPYINFSKFENGEKYVDKIAVVDNTTNSIRYEAAKHLDLIEKRFLSMGIDVEVFKWQHKNAPVKLSLYGTFNYNLSEINMGTEEVKDIKIIKAFNRGGGLHLSAKRFNNFGFDYKAELSWYDYKNFNDDDNFLPPAEIPIFRNEAEVFYHPNKNPNQAIFTRLVSFNYAGSANNQSFYQFQFGYRFAIGARTVSNKGE